ncbi:alanine racemase [Candidatus Aerophobetes bacterium]|nr:alanine racemase [Candidatus Aerophobetes bacterium]
MRPTRVQINLENIAYNIEQIRAKVGNKVNIMAVVKANGYGHGAIQVAKTALKSGCEWLAVATVEEGVELREAEIKSPILILGISPPEQAEDIVKYELSQTICDKKLARALSDEAKSQNRIAKVHIKVDTGMGRIGIFPEKVKEFIKKIAHLKCIKIEGIFTHFSSAEEDKDFTHLQIENFKKAISGLEKEKIHIPLKHAANSAAILHVPSSCFELVRPGIMLYGLYPSLMITHSILLKPAMSFKTQIVYLKTVPAGVSLSYGRSFTTTKKSLIATLPVGYADGYSRALSNKGEVLIKGKRAPVVGAVCMDMILVDVTRIPEVNVGDEVVLFGKQEGAEISVDELASKIGTINYEVICGISKRVPRVYTGRSNGDS